MVSNRKFNKRIDAEQATGDYEVNDYLDKLNVENKRRKELKDNAAVVKRLKSKCDRIQRKVEELGDKIKSRPDLLTKTIRDVLMKINLNNPRRVIQTSSNIHGRDTHQDSNEEGSDSS